MFLQVFRQLNVFTTENFPFLMKDDTSPSTDVLNETFVNILFPAQNRREIRKIFKDKGDVINVFIRITTSIGTLTMSKIFDSLLKDSIIHVRCPK